MMIAILTVNTDFDKRLSIGNANDISVLRNWLQDNTGKLISMY